MSSMASISFQHKILKGPKTKEWGAKLKRKKKKRKERKPNQQKEKKKKKKLLILPQIIRNLLTC